MIRTKNDAAGKQRSRALIGIGPGFSDLIKRLPGISPDPPPGQGPGPGFGGPEWVPQWPAFKMLFPSHLRQGAATAFGFSSARGRGSLFSLLRVAAPLLIRVS